jgi:hypothetical protein
VKFRGSTEKNVEKHYLVGMKRMLSFSLSFLLLVLLCFSSCGNKVQAIEDTSWEIQCFWVGQGLTKIYITFNDDGSLTYRDDSMATYPASWSQGANGSLTMNVDAPGRMPIFRATHDNRKIEGTAIDESGDNAILTGDEQ